MSTLRVCANCRVLVQPRGDDWEHVPDFAERFSREVCETPAPGREPSGSESRFGLARLKSPGGDKHVLRGDLELPGDEAPGPVIVAASGSYKLSLAGDENRPKVIKPMSWGYVTTAGLYGIGTSLVAGKLVGDAERRWLQAELRGFAAALRVTDRDRDVILIGDSKRAFDFIELWRAGHDVMPPGYDMERSGGRESTLGKLARIVREDRDRIAARWIPAEDDHPLNFGASELAKIARSWTDGSRTKDEAAVLARRIAGATLREYRGR